MGLLNYFMSLADAAPFDLTAFKLREEYRNGAYMFSGTYAQNPVTGAVLHVFNNGNSHVFDVNKKISGRKSLDNGLTRGTIFDIVNPSDGGVQDLGGGYDSSGRFHLFYDVHTSFNAGATHWMRYIYSDNDGSSWSTPVNLTRPADGHAGFRMLGQMIENNGILLKPYYTLKDEGDATESKRYVLRSTDGGASWTHILVEATTDYINEGSVLAIGENILYAARVESGAQGWRLYKSADNGLSWTVQGGVTFNEMVGVNYSHPPLLMKFDLEGTEVAAFYYTSRGTKEYKVVYGLASEVITGVAGWKAETKTSILDHDHFNTHGTPTQTSGYGGVIHPFNDLRAIGISYVDFGQTTQVSILYFDLATTHYNTLKNQLGIL